MDMSKSPGYLAVEELVKAQKTHMKLQREFQQSMLEESIEERREVRLISVQWCTYV